MTVAVPYEQDTQPTLTVGDTIEADLATPAVSPTPISIVRAPSLSIYEEWDNLTRYYQSRVADAQAAYDQHTGLAEWSTYLASERCRHMLDVISTYIVHGAEQPLIKHWQLIFGGTVARNALRDFRSRLSVKLFFPCVRFPSKDRILEGTTIELMDGSCHAFQRTIPELLASDARFPWDRPLVVLSWDNVSPWSVIAPGKSFHQMAGFRYVDPKGKVWDTGCVLSDIAMANTAVNPIDAYIGEAERASTKASDHVSKRNSLERAKKALLLHERKIAAWSEITLPQSQLLEVTRQADLFQNGDRAASRGMLLTGPPGTGKTLIARAFGNSISGSFQQLSLPDLKQQHIGASGQRVREVWQTARANQPAVIFLDECEGMFARRGSAETDTISADILQSFLAEWDRGLPSDRVIVIGATNRPDLIDDAAMSRFGTQVAVALPGPAEREAIFHREMEAVFPGAVVPSDIAALTQGMSGRDLRNLAGKVRTTAYPHAPADEHFLAAVGSGRRTRNTRVDAAATWDTLVVEPELLQRLRLTCSLLKDAESWQAKGIDIPRSLLLSGPAGTGKTQIARTLANESGLTFLAATTADVKAGFLGQSGNRVKQLFERARTMTPVILFLDELDIIAPDRSRGQDSLTDEIVGQLLQEVDGIESHEGQVFLLAATNHPDRIDRAVLSRFREQIAIPLPDADGRRRLLATQLRKKKVAFDLEAGAVALAAMTEGRAMSGRDLLGWVGHAEQKALLRAIGDGGPEHFTLLLEDFD